MQPNWITLGFWVIVGLSVIQGLRRGFQRELTLAVARLMSLAMTIVAAWVSWRWSDPFLSWLRTVTSHRLSGQAWSGLMWFFNQPQLERWTFFLLVYLLLSLIFHVPLERVATLATKVRVRSLSSPKFLGGMLGGLVGFVRAIVLTAMLYVALTWFSFPAVARLAHASRPYQAVATHIGERWLKPWLVRELPTLTRNALAPLASNINLFIVPTGQPGHDQGVLLIPQPIATLSHQITAKDASDRARAMSLYTWETTHIRYDWTKYNDYVQRGKWDSQSPLQTLRTGKGVCADYALLYADMAHACGLKVELDEGIGGTGGSWGSHAWNRVWDPVSQRWIPVDTTWGSVEPGWFDHAQFSRTHQVQTAILIEGNRG